jgi:hypothetical protein
LIEYLCRQTNIFLILHRHPQTHCAIVDVHVDEYAVVGLHAKIIIRLVNLCTYRCLSPIR